MDTATQYTNIYYTRFVKSRNIFLQISWKISPFASKVQKVRDSKAFCYAAFVRCAKKWGESYINYGEKYLAPGRILWHNWSTAAVRDAMMWHIRPAHTTISGRERACPMEFISRLSTTANLSAKSSVMGTSAGLSAPTAP